MITYHLFAIYKPQQELLKNNNQVKCLSKHKWCSQCGFKM